MTRKDYEKIAESIRFVMEECEAKERNAKLESHQLGWMNHKGGAIQVAHNLAATFASDNPRFDRERFLRACGVEV